MSKTGENNDADSAPAELDPDRTNPMGSPSVDSDSPSAPDSNKEFGIRTEPPVPFGWIPLPPEELDPLFPDFKILELIGRGGMGAVYKGEQKNLRRAVAIKLLPPEIAEADISFAARFKNEARAMAQLDHPNIVHVYDFGQTETGHWFIVMEFVDGTDFHQLIRSGGLEPQQALQAVSQICDALEYAHNHGYVHRDIKPANIFLSKNGVLKVGDFGLAKMIERDDEHKDEPMLTMTGYAVGTPAYSAPEQLSGGGVDKRTDIYSLGVMLYEMLTCELPRGNFPPPSKKVEIDVRIDDVVLKAMESAPKYRYSSAGEMRADVDVVRSKENSLSKSSLTEAPLKNTFVKGNLSVSAKASKETPEIGENCSRSKIAAKWIWAIAVIIAVGFLSFRVFGDRDSHQSSVLDVPNYQLELKQPVESHFPLSFPEFPPKRPTMPCRLVLIPANHESPEPEPEWAASIRERDQNDLVQITFTVEGDAVGLTASGDVKNLKPGDTTFFENSSPFDSDGYLAINIDGGLTPSGHYIILHSKAPVPRVMYPEDGPFAKIGQFVPIALSSSGKITCPEFMSFPLEKQVVDIGKGFGNRITSFLHPDGSVTFSKTPGLELFKLAPGTAISLGEGGFMMVSPNGALKFSQVTHSEENIEEVQVLQMVPPGSSWRYLNSGGFQTSENKTKGCRVAISSDGSVFLWEGHGSAGRRYPKEYERALFDAQQITFNKSPYIYVLLPADSVPRSGYWEVGELIDARNKLRARHKGL